MRSHIHFQLNNIPLFKKQLLQWASQFKEVSFLNSNFSDNAVASKTNYNTYSLLVAVDAVQKLTINNVNAFEQLKGFYEDQKDWLFGYFGYDLKNEIEKLSSANFDGLGFDEMIFFQPRLIFIVEENKLRVEFLSQFNSEEEIRISVDEIQNTLILEEENSNLIPVSIQPRVSKEQYLQAVYEIKKHIQRGDIYEMNYCVEFFAEQSKPNPIKIYTDLNEISRTPFSCFYRNENKYLMCASPERFIKKVGTKIISQPIKGTRKRGTNEQEDDQLKEELYNDSKERSENVMIVDLVRNDLSRTAKRGTVEVEELFGIYTFKQVHQMISTIVSEVKESIHFMDVIKNAFPMGSMTGAPKVRAMQLIEVFENTKRGLYSGAVGYISPDENFDFNVVIRSILHNATNGYTSFMVGSAITANSEAEREYEECLLKAEAMFQVLR